MSRMDQRLLAEQNPWWASASAVDTDPHLRAYATAHVPWRPRIYHLFPLGPDRVYTLRGPRQVGKTTLVKLLIRRLLLEDNVEPSAVLYYSCDHLRGALELDDLVATYLQWVAPEAGRRYLFLDEISSVDDWAIGIRALANRGKLRGCTLVLTGSHALDLRRQVERLPGRRGESLSNDPEDLLDRVLLPMKFAEYAETRSPELDRAFTEAGLRDRAVRRDAVGRLFDGTGSPVWTRLLATQSALARLLQEYLLTGGFPRPLNDWSASRRIRPETYDLYVRVVVGDLARWGYDERTARELLAGVVEKLGTPVSWRTLAADTDIPDHKTAARYVDALERIFLLQTLYQYDPRKKRRSPRKDRKLYVRDPFMFHAVRGWALGYQDPFNAAQEFLADPAKRGLLLEAIVADHLARLAFATHPTSVFDAYERVLFWRSKKGWEVDFVLRDGKPRALQLTLTRPRSETRRALRAFGGGVILTETGEAESLPLAPFLCLV